MLLVNIKVYVIEWLNIFKTHFLTKNKYFKTLHIGFLKQE